MSRDEKEWLIRKGGYYYRPNRAGYTVSPLEAGRYTEEEARAEASVEPWQMKAIHVDEVMDRSEHAPVDRAEFERLENRLIEAEGHISQLLDNVQSMNSELLDLMERNQATHIYTVPSRQQGKSWLYERYMEAKRAEPQPDSDGWIPWHGGECPVGEDTIVDIERRDRDVIRRRPAAALKWKNDGQPYDIIAYRPAKQEAEWPDMGDRIYYLDETGRVRAGVWGKGSGHRDRDAFLGLYPTREAAEEAAGKIRRVMEHWRKGEAVVLATDARLVTAEKLWLDQH